MGKKMVVAFAALLLACAISEAKAWKVDLSGEWAFSTGDNPAWASPDFDDSQWDRIGAPALWDSYGYEEYDGYGWYRRHFTAPAGIEGRRLLIEIGGVDDDDWVYINGRLVGSHMGCYVAHSFHIPPGLVKPGDNVIAIRIYDGAMGGGLAVGPIEIREETMADVVALEEAAVRAERFGTPQMALELSLRNKTGRSQRIKLTGQLEDYLLRPVLEIDRAVLLKPDERRQVRFQFNGGRLNDYRLALRVSGEIGSTDYYLYPAGDALAGVRKVWRLSGQWDFMPAESLEYPPKGRWKKAKVPSDRWGGWPGKEHHAWFRRTFTVPAQAKGLVFRLRFEAVAHYCVVYLNGQRLGEHLGGFEPFEFDVSDAIKPGQENELVVGVTDWIAGLKPGSPIPEDPQDVPAHSMLIPYGTRVNRLRGIWQDVLLIAHGPVAVVDDFIITSVRNRRVTVRARLRNFSDRPQRVTVKPEVGDAQGLVFAMRRRSLSIPPGDSAEIEWTRQWKNPRLWWPFDPHLYYVRLSVDADGQPSDEQFTRFGFREFWIDGIDYRLNGRVFRLRGLGCTPTSTSPEELREYYLANMQQANVTLLRNHMHPRPKFYYDIADEVGMCLKDESAFYCQARNYALEDERLWENLRRHVTAMVLRARNHPSVCIWSTENEILHCGGIRTKGTDAHIYELGRTIEALDPTRPIEFEGDGDVVGRAATINIHYPREFGCHDHNLWPNDA